MTLTLDSSNSSPDYDDLTVYHGGISPVEASETTRRHRVSCGSLSTSALETSGTKIIRSCSSSFSHASEYHKPLGRYHHLHQQQQLQQQHGGLLDTSVLASAVRVAATIGLTVSGELPGADISPTKSCSSSGGLPYILRSVR